MFVNDKQYWEKFYSEQKMPFKESGFARFCMRNYLKPENKLIELGCGNGRDAIYFYRMGLKVTAIDQCAKEIKFLNDVIGNDNLRFKSDDFSALKISQKYDAIYSRFTLHAISRKQQDATLLWAIQHLNPAGLLLIEARGTKNELYGLGEPVKNEKDAYIFDSHYRRFINKSEIVAFLKKNELAILKSSEAKGYAPFNGTNYKFIRIVAQKTK